MQSSYPSLPSLVGHSGDAHLTRTSSACLDEAGLSSAALERPVFSHVPTTPGESRNRILELIAAGFSLPDVLEAIAREMEAQAPELICSILLLDAAEGVLRHGAAPSLPNAYNNLVDGLAIGPEVGSCGTAAFLARTVCVADIATDPLWAPFVSVALSYDLRACTSIPVISADGAVLGTFALYLRQPGVLTEAQHRLIMDYVHLVGIGITRARQTEALRAGEERFRTIVEAAMEGIWTLDADGCTTYVNGRMAQLLGYTRGEMKGLPFLSFSTEETRAGAEEALREIRLGGAGQHDLCFAKRDGSCIWTLCVVSPIRTDGVVTGAVVMATDVTERRRTEVRNEVLQSLGQRLNTTTSPDDAARVILSAADDLLGWDCGFLELWEADRGLRTMMLTFDVMNGVRTEIPFQEELLRPGSTTARVLTGGAEILLRKPGQESSVRGRIGDTSRPSASLMFAPIRSEGRAVGVLSIQSYTFNAYSEGDLATLQALADYCGGALARTQALAAQQKLEEQLRQAQKMEAVGRLAGGIAHDFNNTLAVINGYTEMVLSDLPEASDQAAPLKEVLRAGTRAAELTRQLLTFSRREIVAPKVLNLNELIAGSAAMLRRLIGEDVEMRTDLAALAPCVRIDAGQMEQVLLNLVINARDAMPRGGKITLATRRDYPNGAPSRILGMEEGDWVTLDVTDTGGGIDAKTLPHIFEPFFTTKPVGEGTGLGLATVYGIIERVGGQITVESGPTHGTTFRVVLPIASDCPEECGETSARPAVAAGGETVLLVEDEEQVRGFVYSVLLKQGYRVLEAGDGVEALAVAAAHKGPIDILVTDVVMPRMGGRDLAHELGRARPDTAVLLMSGYTDDELIRHGVSTSRSEYIQKPFSPGQLAARVRGVLQARSQA